MNHIEEKLSFDKVKQQLSEFAVSFNAKNMCLNIHKMADFDKISNELDFLDTAFFLLENNFDFSFYDFPNINDTVNKIEKIIPLSIIEFLNISKILELSKFNLDKYLSINKKTSLDQFFLSLNPLSNVNNTIKKIIISETEIANNASPNLSELRIKKSKLFDKINSTLNILLTKYKDKLQEPVITMKNNRYCLPFKSEYRSRIRGVVQDASNSNFTVFIEPMEIIELSNEISNITILENEEIYKILLELTKKINNYVVDIKKDIYILDTLDFIFAKAKYARKNKHTKPAISKDKYINLKNAKHPLISENFIPLSIELRNDKNILIITGPNTGGKTVFLKTLGLIHLMGLSGLFIPADENSTISNFDNIYIDIGDEQSIEQNLSTFSAHMKNIINIIKNATENSLCIIDEICTGTDPIEGAKLAIAIIENLKTRNITSFITTHYPEIKLYALSDKKILSGSFEFNVETLMPTYRLILGIPGKSNAFLISEKLGLDKSIISSAKKLLDSDEIHFEDLMKNLMNEKTIIQNEKENLQKKQIEISKIKDSLSLIQKDIEKNKKDILDAAYKKAKDLLRETKEKCDEYLKEIKDVNSDTISIKTRLNSDISKINDMTKEKVKISNISPKKIKLGSTVKILSMNINGIVESLPDKNNNIFVRTGIIKNIVNLSDIELINTDNIKTDAVDFKNYKSTSHLKFEKTKNLSNEINLIGLTTDEAIIKLDKFLDDVYLSTAQTTRIIHGRGSGALKKAIHNHLRKLPIVKDFRLGDFTEGGDGATIVYFK